jgi:feruloyl esterase
MRKRVQLQIALGLVGASALAGTFFQSPVMAGSLQGQCSTSAIAQIFAGEPDTTVLAAKSFSKGQLLPLAGPQSYTAEHELCMVKLRVGPGTPGPAGAPSTQAGIGLEIWLPAPESWNGRVHNLGGGGFVGEMEVTDPERIVPNIGEGVAPAVVASREGAVSGFTDTGHALPAGGADGSFLMLPDGSVNTAQWRDFSERGIHMLAVKSKQLAAAYYGRPADHSYFEGCSTGGRQAHKLAQKFPQDYDGIIGGAPAMNWTRFITSELYPQLVMQRELSAPISPAKLMRASSAAVSACDLNGGRHMGYITAPAQCRYNPEKDKTLLCRNDGGSDASATCFSRREAKVLNKIWYGQTSDGSSPDPEHSNGFSTQLEDARHWFGIPRGTQQLLAMSRDGVATPFPIALHMVALIAGRGGLADASFKNAAGNGGDGWKDLTYLQLSEISARGDAQQSLFSNINSDSTDLAAFRAHGGKFLAYHGLADQLIAPEGTMRYYEALSRRFGGVAPTREFYRFITVPGMGHCQGVGSVDGLQGVSPVSAPPLPASGQLYAALVSWVEQGKAPDSLLVTSREGETHPLCEYPKELRFLGGDVKNAASYRCQ